MQQRSIMCRFMCRKSQVSAFFLWFICRYSAFHAMDWARIRPGFAVFSGVWETCDPRFSAVIRHIRPEKRWSYEFAAETVFANVFKDIFARKFKIEIAAVLKIFAVFLIDPCHFGSRKKTREIAFTFRWKSRWNKNQSCLFSVLYEYWKRNWFWIRSATINGAYDKR